MYSFRNDYSEGTHPRILQALTDTNLEQTCGYGLDSCCAEAAALIRTQCAAPEADVHFVVGGTQANLLVIHALIHSYEAVIAAETGHVNVHETGAIEATGHKVCTAPAPDGKLTPALVEAVVNAHSSEHMVHPRLVYVSQSTEIGTLYEKEELEALRRCCDHNGLLLYLDGARLGSALDALNGTLTLADLARLTDVFTIGGTKNGLLFGEALIFRDAALSTHFRWYMKQRGAVLAKGRLLGIQFREALRDGLYFTLARHANETAARLRDGMLSLSVPFPLDSRSNQLFPVLPNTVIQALEERYEFDVGQPADDTHTAVRLVTSWATPQTAVDAFLRDLAACMKR